MTAEQRGAERGFLVRTRAHASAGECEFLRSVSMERLAQIRKWGQEQQQHDVLEWVSILTEEVGEAAAEANTLHWNTLTPSNQVVVRQRFYSELVQIAAVCCAACEQLSDEIAALSDSAPQPSEGGK